MRQYRDITKPDPAWSLDQKHVYEERLAIMGEARLSGNTFAEYAQAFRQADIWYAQLLIADEILNPTKRPQT